MKSFRIQSCLSYLLITLSVLLFACASGHKEPFAYDTPTARSIQELKDRLAQIVVSSSNLSLKSIGQVEYGPFSAQVQVMTFRPGGETLGRVLVCGGIHGNEPAGVEAVLGLMEAITKNPEDYGGLSFDFIPCINPWGYTHDIRFNRNGRDVNRDFATFKTLEATIVRDYVQGQTYDLILDHHEDPSAQGFYLYQYLRPDQSLGRKVIKKVREEGYPIEQDVNMIVLQTKDGLIDAPRWGLWYMKLTRQLSMANYFRLNNSDQVYTIETPTALDPEERLHMHRLAQGLLINHLLESRPKE